MQVDKPRLFRNIDFGIPEGFNRNYDFWFSDIPPYLTKTPAQKNRERLREYARKKAKMKK